MALTNDITKSVDGCDNLPIRVTLFNEDDDGMHEQELAWRQARAVLAKPLCELYEASLRWVLDVEHLLGWQVTLVRISLRNDITDRLRMRVCLRATNGEEFSHLGNTSLEEDTLPKDGGPTLLYLSGTLQELEERYEDAIYRQQRKEQQP